MFEDPIYGKKDGNDENDWSQTCQQAEKPHTCRALSIDRPNEPDPHNKQQNERAHS
jgi:hypothetical protein